MENPAADLLRADVVFVSRTGFVDGDFVCCKNLLGSLSAVCIGGLRGFLPGYRRSCRADDQTQTQSSARLFSTTLSELDKDRDSLGSRT